MNELQNPTLKRPLDKSTLGAEVGALNNLMGMLNDPRITGADVPKEDRGSSPVDKAGATMIATDPAVAASSSPRVSQPVTAQPLRRITANKFAFTGRVKAGKDFVASSLGAKIFGFAEPLYFLQDYFFGTNAATNPADKDIPGARQFLQTVGQWGWGAVSKEYPLTPARATFNIMIRSLAKSGAFPESLHVDWDGFGRLQTLWVDAAFRRIDDYLSVNPGARVAIVNARFEHEFKPVIAAGFEHYHVMLSPKTWAGRLAKSGLSETSPQLNDNSEKLAHTLDNSVIKQISSQKSGPMLRAIWNDEVSPSPSQRLYNLQQFLQAAVVGGTSPSAPGYAEE